MSDFSGISGSELLHRSSLCLTVLIREHVDGDIIQQPFHGGWTPSEALAWACEFHLGDASGKDAFHVSVHASEATLIEAEQFLLEAFEAEREVLA
jgi:hypothetical protein